MRDQIKELVKYFRKNEKPKQEFKLGVEFEYFVVDVNSLKVISYDGDNGLMNTFEELLNKGFQGLYENKFLLGLKKNGSTITLEPGSQLEISIKPHKKVNDIETEYLEILSDLLTILEEKGQMLLATGYQVQNKLDEVNIIPKKRYEHMSNYLIKRGSMSINMMKQTASTQVCIDYESEEDFQDKYRILYTLSPIFYAFFDNSPFFEGDIYPKNCIRSQIWDNCDNERCNIMAEVLTTNFNYESYAKFILKQKAIVFENKFTDQLFTDLFNTSDYKSNELEHMLSMVFPEIRLRSFIEIRIFDSLPYPFNLSLAALIKGSFYSSDNLKDLSKFIKEINFESVLQAKNNIIEKGVHTIYNGHRIYEFMKCLLSLAIKGLDEEERKYLIPISRLIQLKMNPKEYTTNLIDLGKLNALNWCIINKKGWESIKWIQAV